MIAQRLQLSKAEFAVVRRHWTGFGQRQAGLWRSEQRAVDVESELLIGMFDPVHVGQAQGVDTKAAVAQVLELRQSGHASRTADEPASQRPDPQSTRTTRHRQLPLEMDFSAET